MSAAPLHKSDVKKPNHRKHVRWYVPWTLLLCLLGGTAVALRSADADVPSTETSQAQGMGGRAALPTSPARKEAEAEIDRSFEKELAAATTSEKRKSLATTLLEVSEEENNAANRFVLIEKARQLAIATGDIDLAMTAASQLAWLYKVNELTVKSKTLIDVSQKLGSRAAHETMTTAAVNLADFAVSQEKFEIALNLTDVAIASARRADRIETERDVKKRRRELDKMRKAFEIVKSDLAILDDNPADPDANLNAGRYYCFQIGNWELGISMLALGSDTNLQLAARMELAEATPPVKIGDAWWELAESESGTTDSAAMRNRAVDWYRRGLPELAGLDRARVTKRIPAEAPDEDEVEDDPRQPAKKRFTTVRRSLLARIRRAVRNKEFETSKEAYGDEDAIGEKSRPFSIPSDVYLVGLDVSLSVQKGKPNVKGKGRWKPTAKGKISIVGIRPYFETSRGITAGKLVGYPSTMTAQFRPNEPGYAIGTIQVAVSEEDARIHGLKVTFMMIGEDRLDPNQSYESERSVGSMKGKRIITLGGNGQPIIGLVGHFKATYLSALGVVQTQVPSQRGDSSFEAHYDFGTGSSPVETGYTQATIGSWTNLVEGGDVDRSKGSDLERDLCYMHDGTYTVTSVPADTYTVTLYIGDLDSSKPLRDKNDVYLQGKLVENDLDTPTATMLMRTYNGIVVDGSGKLTVRLVGLGGSNDFVLVAGMDVVQQ